MLERFTHTICRCFARFCKKQWCFAVFLVERCPPPTKQLARVWTSKKCWHVGKGYILQIFVAKSICRYLTAPCKFFSPHLNIRLQTLFFWYFCKMQWRFAVLLCWQSRCVISLPSRLSPSRLRCNLPLQPCLLWDFVG